MYGKYKKEKGKVILKRKIIKSVKSYSFEKINRK